MRSDADALQRVESVRTDVVALLRAKRYEEALAALYRARSEAPGDRELQKSIDQIKEFLIGAYAKRLGGLDQVATPIPLAAVRSPDAVLLARYIDGTSTFGDLAQICPLGQLRTLQVLVGLYQGTEPPRIDTEAPHSGLRVPPDAPLQPPASYRTSSVADDDQPAPDTARSASVAAVARAVETDEARRYNEMFALGTAAFVQARYRDAVEAFESCARLRPGDRAAAVMLRRSLHDLESR